MATTSTSKEQGKTEATAAERLMEAREAMKSKTIHALQIWKTCTYICFSSSQLWRRSLTSSTLDWMMRLWECVCSCWRLEWILRLWPQWFRNWGGRRAESGWAGDGTHTHTPYPHLHIHTQHRRKRSQDDIIPHTAHQQHPTNSEHSLRHYQAHMCHLFMTLCMTEWIND